MSLIPFLSLSRVPANVRCDSILNLLVGINGLKLWARNKRQQKETATVAEEAPKFADEKAVLLEN